MSTYLKKSIEQYRSSLTKQEKTLRIYVVIFGELFSLLTLLRLFLNGEYIIHLLMAIGTCFLILLPIAVEIVFRSRMHTALYIAAELYAIGPMLGECYKLYYTTVWWDKLLHAFGGFAFALFGVFLLRLLCENEPKRIASAVFALCFSISISVIWEFVEYSGDNLFGMDMQNDTIVHEIHSYYLGNSLDIPGDITSIDSVTVNGVALPFDGYLDIGLHDTMRDMLIETFGAVAAVVLFSACKGKNQLFISFTKELEGQNCNG